MLRKQRGKPITGRLTEIKHGFIFGEITLHHAMRGHGDITIELSAHGISITTSKVQLGSISSAQSFKIPIVGFPKVTLPADIRARIVETDTLLDGDITIQNLQDVWKRMMPFQAKIEACSETEVFIRIAERTTKELPIFELRAWGTAIASSVPHGTPPKLAASEGVLLRIDVPMQALDGGDHRLSVVHLDSGLPLQSQPVVLKKSEAFGPASALSALDARLARLEKEVQDNGAKAFQIAVAPIYRHIDQLAQLQRSNFEAEVAAIRGLLGHDDAEAARIAVIADSCRVEMTDFMMGYGIHEATKSSSGKTFRWAASSAGILLPGLSNSRPSKLLIQGLRRMHADSLQDILLHMNGQRLETQMYLNPKSESWNVQAALAKGLLRPDRNLLEMRIPHGPLDGGSNPATKNKAVGLLFIEVSSANTVAAVA